MPGLTLFLMTRGHRIILPGDFGCLVDGTANSAQLFRIAGIAFVLGAVVVNHRAGRHEGEQADEQDR